MGWQLPFASLVLLRSEERRQRWGSKCRILLMKWK